MTLSVCFLTRNEEPHIVRALRSVAGLADQVVVADTGSTDATVLLATELGAEVHLFAWDDDFAAGRNFDVERARGDWLLWMQADEELVEAGHAAVRACTSQEDVLAFFVHVQNLLAADRPELVSETSDLRLFRRLPELRFVGRLHPGFTPAALERLKRTGREVQLSEVTLRSAAHLTKATPAKLGWTARLLERELQDRPGQLHYLIEYGRTLLALQEPKGHAVLGEAAAQVFSARDAPTPPSQKVQVLLEYLLTALPEHSRNPLSAAEARELALRWFPNSPPLVYLNAELAFRGGEFRLAARLLERLLHLGRNGTYDRSRVFDPGLVGEDALINLAACHQRLGEWERAEECYRQLLTGTKFSAQAAQGLVAVKQLRGQPPGPIG
jgi:glycosyltransferase involved in cell wall biosynthesis